MFYQISLLHAESPSEEYTHVKSKLTQVYLREGALYTHKFVQVAKGSRPLRRKLQVRTVMEESYFGVRA
jgi:hypothetical protein